MQIAEQRRISVNRCDLTGRLTKDPELKMLGNNNPCCTFTLAVNRRFSKETDFINIVVWGKTGENCANYLSKGKLAAVAGELHIRTYETKDGRKATATEVVADQVDFLSPKNEAPKFNDDEGMPF